MAKNPSGVGQLKVGWLGGTVLLDGAVVVFGVVTVVGASSVIYFKKKEKL